MASMREAMLWGLGTTLRGLNLVLCPIVLMKASVVSTTSFFALASFCKTTFHPSFLDRFEKNTYVAWFCKYEWSDIQGNLWRKFTSRNLASSRAYIGLPLLSCFFIHSYHNRALVCPTKLQCS